MSESTPRLIQSISCYAGAMGYYSFESLITPIYNGYTKDKMINYNNIYYRTVIKEKWSQNLQFGLRNGLKVPCGKK